MQQLIVIGNGMSGIAMVEALLQRAPGRYVITVIGREPHGNYNRILLSPVLGREKTVADALTHPPQWYAQRDISLLMGEEVLRVDLRARELHTDRRTLRWLSLIHI